jgi:hypothetical protein
MMIQDSKDGDYLRINLNKVTQLTEVNPRSSNISDNYIMRVVEYLLILRWTNDVYLNVFTKYNVR